MYERFVKSRRGGIWEILYSQLRGRHGGYKEAAAAIRGDGAYGTMMRMEAGVHRVQRVPSTEAAGRIHTSAMTCGGVA